MKKVSKGIALTVLSALLSFNAAFADSFVAYGASYGEGAESAAFFSDQIEDDNIQTEEAIEDASVFDVSEEPQAEDSVDEPGAEKSEQEDASEEYSKEDAPDEASSEASTEEDASDEASSEDSMDEDAADAASSETSEEAPIDEENKPPVGVADNQVGDNVFYTIKNGVITLTGTGATYDYGQSKDPSPFYYHKGIKSIVVEEGITELGSNLFIGVGDREVNTGKSLKSIKLPESLTKVGVSCFNSIYAVEGSEFIFPTGLKEVDEWGMAMHFDKVGFAEGRTEIYPNMLYGMSAKTLTLPTSLEKIDSYAFNGFSYRNKLTMPKNIKKIETYAFVGYEGEFFYFEGNAPEIEDKAFALHEDDATSYYYRIQSYYMFGYYPKDDSTWTKEVVESYEARNPDIDFRALNGERSDKCGENITWSYKNHVLTLKGSGKMYDYAANNQAPWAELRSSIQRVDFDSRITSIGDFAFYKMDYLVSTPQNTVLPSSLTRIGKFAFYEARLYNVTFPSGVTYIGDYAFYDTVFMQMGRTVLNSEMTYLGDYAFYDCSYAELVYPKFTKLTRIGDYAFSNCRKATGSLEFSDKITYIGKYAFSQNVLTESELHIPKNLTFLGDHAFYNIPNAYGDIVIPDAVEDIGQYTFDNNGITSVVIGNGVATLGHGCFRNCSKLKSVKLGDSINYICSGVFLNCPELTEVEIPASLTKIDMSCVYNSGIKKVTFKGDIPSIIWASRADSSASAPMNLEIHYPLNLRSWYILSDEKKAEKLYLTKNDPVFVPDGEAKILKVTFLDAWDRNVVLNEQDVIAGQCADKSLIQVEGYDVGYCYCDMNGYIRPYDFSDPVYDDLIVRVFLDPKEFTVTYDPMDGSEAKVEKRQYNSEIYSEPSCPFTREGMVFVGWSLTPTKDGRLGEKYSFSLEAPYVVKGDVTFYARWLSAQVVINYDTGYEKTMDSKKIAINGYNDNIGYLYDLYRQGYIFEGWYYDKEFTQKAEDQDPLLYSEITLYAKWTQIKYKVFFDASAAENIESFTIEVPEGELITLPDMETPYKEGCEFVGWCEEDYEPFDFKWRNIYNDITLHACFANIEENMSFGDLEYSDMRRVGINYAEQIPKQGWVCCDKSYTYTGKAIIPTNVKVFYYKSLLKAGRDYTISYKDTVKPGKAKITVKFKGSYSGVLEDYYTINPVYLSSQRSLGRLKLSQDDIYLAYNGKVQKAKVTLKLTRNGKTVTLKEGTDYTYEYPTSDVTRKIKNEDVLKAPGTYAVRIVGKNGYTSSVTVYEHITEAKLMSKVKVTGVKNMTYTGEPIEQTGMVVKYGSEVLKQDEDFTVDYNDTNTEIGTATITLTAKEGSAYEGTKTVTFKITGAAISKAKIVGFKASVPYDFGKKITQDIKLYESDKAAKAGGEEGLLTPDKDYHVEFANNTNAGTATMTITGIGRYSGTVKKTYKITPFDVSQPDGISMTVRQDGEKNDEIFARVSSRVVVIMSASYRCIKSGVKPNPSVYYKDAEGKYKYLSNANYSFTYGKNDKPGEGNGLIKFTGKGNYKGSAKCSFDITNPLLNNCRITMSDIKHKYAAGSYKPQITVADRTGKKLTAGKDYSVKITYNEDTELLVYDKATKKYIPSGNVAKKGTVVDQKKDIIPENTVLKILLYPQGNYEIIDSKGKKYDCLYDTVKVYGGSINIANAEFQIADKLCLGKAIKLSEADFTVASLEGKELTLDKDFVITGYSNNVLAGTAKVTLQGIEDYSGTKTVTFKITKAQLGN